MARTYEIAVDTFSGGISDDPRLERIGEGAMVKHFDIHYSPKRLRPNRSFVSDMHDGTTSTGMRQYNVRDFLWDRSNQRIWGVGRRSDGTGTKVVWRGINDTQWTLPASSESALDYIRGSAIFNPSLGRIYFIAQNGSQAQLVHYTTGSPAFTNIGSAFASTSGFTETMRPIQAPDANWYFGLSWSNSFVRLRDPSGTAAYDDVSTIVPSGMFPSSLCNYGDFIAIGLQPNTLSTTTGTNHSRVHLYDMVNLDPVQVIDFGPGRLLNLQNVDGTLIGVLDRYVGSALGNDEGAVVIRTWSGGSAVRARTVKEIRAAATGGIGGTYYSEPRKEGVSFYAKIPTNAAGTTFDEGIWNYGRRTANEPMALSLEVDTSNFTDSDGVQSFAQIGEFLIVNHSGDGSIHSTATTPTYSYTSTFDTQVYSRRFENQMTCLSLTTEPLPAGASATVRYRVNGATAWTEGLTITSTGATYELTTRPPSGEFPKFHEIQFRIESTGGAVPLKLRARYETLNSQGEDE